MSKRPFSLAALAALAVLAALAAPSSVLAQDRTAAVDGIFAFATPETPGCAVAVSHRGQLVIDRTYGLANVEARALLDSISVFDIGSTQKQFTAAAILLLVEDRRLALTDDVRRYIPELPDYGRPITIDHLLTHTGGIRDWTGLLPFAPPGTEVWPLILRQRGVNFAPGEEWSYSSSGFELLKEIVARVSGMPFAEFARRRLFTPLGMRSAAYVPDIMQAGSAAAMGYQRAGTGWRPFMRLGNARAGGAIVANASDLVRWQDALAAGRLSRFVSSRIVEPARLNNGRRLRYARALFVDSTPAGTVISHSGGAAGFSTFMGRFPDHGLAVAVACNFDPVSASDLGEQVANLYLPPVSDAARAAFQARLRDSVTGDASSRAGIFFEAATGAPLQLTVTNGRLGFFNGPRLTRVAENRWRMMRGAIMFMSQDEFTLTFSDADHVELRSMEGVVTRYRRAQASTPTAAELQAYDGRYRSDELGSVFEIVAGANGLALRMEHAPERSVPLTAVERDVWNSRGIFVRFQRDANGAVTGFDFSNPVVRHNAFARVGDRASR